MSKLHIEINIFITTTAINQSEEAQSISEPHLQQRSQSEESNQIPSEPADQLPSELISFDLPTPSLPTSDLVIIDQTASDLIIFEQHEGTSGRPDLDQGKCHQIPT